MSEHDQLCGLMADLISEQSRTTEAVVKLTEALAGIRSKVDAPTKAVIDKAVAKAKETETVAPAPAPSEPVAPAAASSPAEVAVSAAEVLNYTEHVAPTMGRLLNEKGVGVVKSMLAEFGVKKGAELPYESLAAALARAEEILRG